LIYVDREQHFAVLAQGYESSKPMREAPANKAADLNTAVSWALGENLSALPAQILAAARELREAIADGAVTRLHIWYVHASPESSNVRQELRGVERGAFRVAKENGWNKLDIEVLEVGDSRLEDWYSALTSTIQVDSKELIKIPGGYTIEHPEGDWSAAVTSVPLSWLHGVFATHKSKLFSANIRGYLGVRDTDENINNGIKTSALTEPENFWAFNNGITALVHDFNFCQEKRARLS
jgi:hypothetical protein